MGHGEQTISNRVRENFWQTARFFLVGGTTGLLYVVLFYALVELLTMPIVLASTLVCFAAMLYNYLMHYHWTFASNASHKGVLVRYLIMCAGAVVGNALIMHFGTTKTDIHYMIVQFVGIAFMASWNLCLSSFWVFQQLPQQEKTDSHRSSVSSGS